MADSYHLVHGLFCWFPFSMMSFPLQYLAHCHIIIYLLCLIINVYLLCLKICHMCHCYNKLIFLFVTSDFSKHHQSFFCILFFWNSSVAELVFRRHCSMPLLLTIPSIIDNLRWPCSLYCISTLFPGTLCSLQLLL